MQTEPTGGAPASPNRPSRGRKALSAAFAAALAVLAFGLLAATASAAVSGQGVVSLGVGKAGKSLTNNKVRVRAVKPAINRRAKANVTRVAAPVRSVTVAKRARVQLAGGIRFRRGKRAVTFRRPLLVIGARNAVMRVRVGKRQVALFRLRGRSVLNRKTNIVRTANAKAVLTPAATRLLRNRLRAPHLRGGIAGRFALRAADRQPQKEEPDPDPGDLDPYFEACGISATSQLAGNFPAPSALPTLSGAKATVGSDIAWGLKESLRGYVFGFNQAKGLQALDGATRAPGMNPTRGFVFPAVAGQYAANDPVDMTDDQAIINSSGTALFCNKPHGFRYVLSNVTIVIDGENSRIVADVDTNQSGVWIPAERVDFADLDLTGITPFYNFSGSEITWSDIPAKLTAAGAAALCGGAGDNPCDYSAGSEVDSITAQARTPYDTSDLAALTTYVENNLPFPILDPSEGGCSIPVLPDPKTIDAAQAATPGGNPNWLGVPDSAKPTPDLTGSEPVIAGGLDWGLRGSLRGTINATGEFNVALGATASHAPYYGAGGLMPVGPPRNPAGDMGNTEGRYFTWPSTTAGSFYDLGADPGFEDDRVVLSTEGRVAFCQSHSAQAYGTVLSNPTVVIDGEDSRITIDVATRYRLSWVRGVVDIAKLDLEHEGAAVMLDFNGSEVTATWSFPSEGAVILTKAGEAVLNMLNPAYAEGLLLDGVTVRATFESVI